MNLTLPTNLKYTFEMLSIIVSFTQAQLEQQVKELATKLEEDVASASKAAKREAAKLQQRVRTLLDQLTCHYCHLTDLGT